jgi:hypothetical protein
LPPYRPRAIFRDCAVTADAMSAALYAVVGAALLGAVMGVFIDKWLVALLSMVPLIVAPMGLILLMRTPLEHSQALAETMREPLLELADVSVLMQMALAYAGGVILAGALMRAVRGDRALTAQTAPHRASVKKRVAAVSERTPLQNRTDRVAAAPRPALPVAPPPVYEVTTLPGSINVSSVADKVRDTGVESNRRARGRRRAILAGYLMFDDGRSAACRIVDVSDTGAKVRLPAMLPLPETFWLLNRSDWLAHEVKLAWRTEVEAGLLYLSKRNLREPVTEQDHALHALCASLAAR